MGIPAGEFKSFLMKEMTDRGLNAGGLMEVGLLLKISNHVEHGLIGEGGQVFRAPGDT